MSPVQAKQIRVVARYRDGRMIKGTTHDFYPNKPQFHVHEAGDENRRAIAVPLSELKAVFFVKTYEGDRNRADSAEEIRGQGRRMRVKFFDGEELDGFTMGYNQNNPGFFIVPAAVKTNNERIYVIHEAVERVEWC